MTIDQLKNLLFRILHGFRGYPKEIHGIPFRVDESLRRFENGGEETVQEILNTQLKQGDLYVDVGANYGLHAMLAAHYVGETGRVFAFEPVPTNLRLLQRNLKLNGFQERSKVFPCALNSTGGEMVEMTIEPGLSPAASLAENFNGSKIQVPTRTLDDCLDQEGAVPALIKIDVEGAEHEVLKGASETLKKGPPLLVEVHTFALPAFNSSPEELREYLATFGYVEERVSEMESHLGEYFHALYRVP
jgi:FkbM family methyltransferase